MCTNQDWVIFGNSCGVVNFCGQIKSTPTHTANLSSRSKLFDKQNKTQECFPSFNFIAVYFILLITIKKKLEEGTLFGLFWEAVELWHTAGCGFIATDFLSQVQYAATQHIWVTKAIHLHPLAQCRTHKRQFPLTKYTRTNFQNSPGAEIIFTPNK